LANAVIAEVHLAAVILAGFPISRALTLPVDGTCLAGQLLPVTVLYVLLVGSFGSHTGLKNVNKRPVLVYPELFLCLDCGNAQFTVPKDELALLAETDATTEPG
jgi:hypothetical protein